MNESHPWHSHLTRSAERRRRRHLFYPGDLLRPVARALVFFPGDRSIILPKESVCINLGRYCRPTDDGVEGRCSSCGGDPCQLINVLFSVASGANGIGRTNVQWFINEVSS